MALLLGLFILFVLFIIWINSGSESNGDDFHYGPKGGRYRYRKNARGETYKDYNNLGKSDDDLLGAFLEGFSGGAGRGRGRGRGRRR